MVPGRDQQWYKNTVKEFGQENFDQEFGLQFDVAASKLIRSKDFILMNKIKKEFINVDINGVPKKVADMIWWHPRFRPDELTTNDLLTRRFVMVIDTAEGTEAGEKGKEDSDWNIISIYEVCLLS